MDIADAVTRASGVATVRGWVYRERGNKSVRFLVLRDAESLLQCVLHRSSSSDALWDRAAGLRMEAAVEVSGTLAREPRAPTGVELTITSLTVVGPSNEFPITKDQSPEHLANYRHLWLRSRKMSAVLRIRHTVFQAFREYFVDHGFYEFHSPIFQATQAEGGSSLFPVRYFDDELFLAQTWQLYAEAGIFSLERMFTIAPSFRAENSKTSRHLTEYWHAEAEMAWTDFDGVIDVAEGVIQHVLRRVLARHEDDLALLGRAVDALRPSAEKRFPRMTYTEALLLLEERKGMRIPWGKDLRTHEEDALSSLFDTVIIVTRYPKAVKAFYMKEDPVRSDVVLGVDFIAPEGYGELVGGSQREDNYEKLVARLREEGEDPAAYAYYLDTRLYGSVPHGGFGLGMERLVSWICGLDSIKDAIPFPRTPTRYRP